MTSILLSPPKIEGTIKYRPFYQSMELGSTAPILLIGHADALEMETPYRVYDMQAAINWLSAGQAQPLLRALMEAYNTGARDIFLYAAAPMSEYVSDLSDRNTVKVEFGNKTFYELYYERLAAAYEILSNYEDFEVVVPVEASFCDNADIDFVKPLADFCNSVFTRTSTSTVGILGSRSVAYNQDLYDNVVVDSNLQSVGDNGKLVMMVMGEGILVQPQFSQSYAASYATQVAAMYASKSLQRSIFGLRFRIVSGMAGFNLSEAQIKQLVTAKVNPVVRSQKGKRGQSFQTKLISDNTLAADGSDYWSINQMRLVNYCVNEIKSISKGFIGTNASESFKQTIYDFMRLLLSNEIINDYGLAIETNPREGKATVVVSIQPVFSIRSIYFTVETGPGL
jgi:hypothetical protein